MAEGRVRGFSIATKCATTAELIEKFRDRVDEESILVNTVESRDVGTECAFAILLADKKVGLAGTCVVRDVFVDTNNPFKRPGMRLQIKRLGPESQKVWSELVAKRLEPRKMTQALPVIAMPAVTKKPRVATIPPVDDRPDRPRTDPTPAKPRTVTSQAVSSPKPAVVVPPVDAAKPAKPATPVATKPATPVAAKPVTPVATPPAAAAKSVTPPSVPTVAAPATPVTPVAAPVIVMPRAKARTTGQGLDVTDNSQSRRVPTVQPVGEEAQEPLARAPRATPFDLDHLAKAAAFGVTSDVTTPDAVAVEEPPAAVAKPALKIVEAKPVDAKKSTPIEGTRTPGSPYVLPANPLANIADASLEGYVDCRLTEAFGSDSPAAFPAGTLDAEPEADRASEPPEVFAPPPPVDEPAMIVARPPVDTPPEERSSPRTRPAGVTAPLKPMISVKPPPRRPRDSEPQPLPLPPPPALPGTTARPYSASKLPDLNVPDANDRARMPLLKRRVRNQLLLAVLIVPLLGAAGMVAYMQFAAAPAATVATLAPDAVATLDEPVTASARIEPAPEATEQVAEPAPPLPKGPQPIHAVLVKSLPIAARVTVGGRSFGTTPTYVKIRANTPVELVLFRPGFKPVKYPFTSKTATDRIFIRLERARGGK